MKETPLILNATPARIVASGILRVEVRNKILGDSVFWEGPSKDINTIRNIPARMLAEKVAIDGVPRVSGMWHVSMLP